MRYLKLTIIFIILLCSFGCDNPSMWQSGNINIENYKCSPEQFELVTKEYKLCQETGYVNSYCFAAAKATICERITGMTP